MYKKYFFEDFRFLYIMSGIFVLAIMLGSVFCGLMSIDKNIEIKDYLTAFLNNTASINRYNTALSAVKELFVMFLIIFISAFFKAGTILNTLVLLKKGFVLGFTFSSFFKAFGIGGILGVLAMLPELLVLVPALLFFSSNSTKMAVLSAETRKKFLFFFIIFSLFFGTIFCASGFLNGYLTTTFMKWASVKIL